VKRSNEGFRFVFGVNPKEKNFKGPSEGIHDRFFSEGVSTSVTGAQIQYSMLSLAASQIGISD